jgi:hypothetical protein
MAVYLSWLQANWAAVIAGMCGIGSLWFTGAYFREDSKNRLVANILAIEERYRALWSEAQQRQDLKRIFLVGADILAQPVSTEEDVFLRRIILHFESGWRLERIMNRGEIKMLAQDAAEFLSLPLPRAVWEKTKIFRNRRFVRFVERAMSANSGWRLKRT